MNSEVEFTPHKPQFDINQVLTLQHTEWLGHPVTSQMISHMRDLREKYTRALAGYSIDSTVPNEMFRMYSYGIKTIDTILALVTTTSEFVAKAESNKPNQQ